LETLESGRKLLEQQLVQAQKMEAIGTLAGGIAHDFNNLLTSIIGFAELALLEPDNNNEWRECISRIPEQGRRAAKLIAQLLAFSRRAVTEKQPMSLQPLVKETVKMLERTLPENISIRLHAGGVASVNADPVQMQQVLMNLCVNAGQAMPNGGELIISLENVTLDEAYCRQYVYARPGEHVCLSVRDTGVGMTKEVQEHIFEPFFTTKGEEEGTGLGLAMVYGIIKSHEGHINVYSEVGKGSEFKVYLPAIKDRPVPQKTVEDVLAGGTETVLLVEDEDIVLSAGKQILGKLGYEVLTATNGREALEVYRGHSGIALVIADMIMPQMGGRELYQALMTVNRDVKVLLMSGYSLREEIAELRAIGLRGFLQKPFDLHTMGKAVRHVLDA
jgi:nitrogen-specific signal transduction histidine kinase